MACSGNALQIAACVASGDIKDSVAGAVASTVMGPMAKEMMDSFDSFLKDFMTSWLGPGLLVDLDGVSVNWFKTSVNTITVTLMVVGLVFAGIRIMMENRSAPFKEAAKSFFQVIFVVTASTILINALILGGDSYSKWILDESGTGVDPFGIQSAVLLANPGLALIVGLVGIFAVLLQWLIMLGRNATLPLLVAFWPTAAAANLVSAKTDMFGKVTGWIIAFIIYKPMAATIYAFAWKLKSGSDGIAGVLNGVVLIVLAILTLPALLRLIAPTTAALGNASGGSMAVGAGAAVISAGVAAGAMVATGGASAAATGGGAVAKAGGGAAAKAGTGAAAKAGAGSAGGGAAKGGSAALGKSSPTPRPTPTPGASSSGEAAANGASAAGSSSGGRAGGGWGSAGGAQELPASNYSNLASGTAAGSAPASGGGSAPTSGAPSFSREGGGAASGAGPSTGGGSAAAASGSTPSSGGAVPASGSAPSSGGGGVSAANGSAPVSGGATPASGSAPASGGAAPASGSASRGSGTRAAARMAEAGVQAARGISDQATQEGRD